MRIAVSRTALLALALLVAAPASPATRLTVPYEMFRLPNGLTVILHEDHIGADGERRTSGTTSARAARRRAAPASRTSSST